MKSLRRWLKRRRELVGIGERKQRLQEELGREFGKSVELEPAAAKGGYDEIFYASIGGEQVAVVRVNSTLKEQSDPIGPLDPGVPLGPADRIDREWLAYQILSGEGLSPRPLWRTDDAMACSWLPGERLSRLLAKDRGQFWPMMERLFPLVARMHVLGVTHLDLNLGNILVSPDFTELSIIDFEFGPVPWVTVGQQMAFDHLRLIDDSLKKRRGGNLLKADPRRLVEILAPCVGVDARAAELDFAFDKLKRLAGEPELRSHLREVFSRLP